MKILNVETRIYDPDDGSMSWHHQVLCANCDCYESRPLSDQKMWSCKKRVSTFKSQSLEDMEEAPSVHLLDYLVRKIPAHTDLHSDDVLIQHLIFSEMKF